MGKQRLASLRRVKIAKNQKPFVTMTKKEVVEKKLLSQVVMPVDIVLSFTKWWVSIDDVDMVKLHNPMGRYGLCGKPSNNAKEQTRKDLHSQPNGRQEGSYGAHFYSQDLLLLINK